MLNESIRNELEQGAHTLLRTAREVSGQISAAVELITECYRNGGKMLLAGNGGSAADAQHIATEFMVRFRQERDPLPAIALSTDTSILTAIGNDYGFDVLFSRQLKALGNKGDVFVAISTSGMSRNILLAAQQAKTKGIGVIGLMGKGGGRLKDIVDIAIIIPSDNTARIQESHITIGHIISGLVEKELMNDLVAPPPKLLEYSHADTVEMENF